MRPTTFYGICQQELLKVLACKWQVIGEQLILARTKYLFHYLPAGKEKEFLALLDLSSIEKVK